MDFAYVGPIFSDHKTDSNDARKRNKQIHKHKKYKKVHSKSFACPSHSSGNLSRITNLKHIAAKYDNLYKTSYYSNLIPKNDKWIHAPLKVPQNIAHTIENHNKILQTFKCPDNKHIYSSDIQQCLDLFNTLRTCDNKQWKLNEEKQDLKIYFHNIHKHMIKSEIILPFSTPIITGIILNNEFHRQKWDKHFESQQFIKRYSMFTHISYEQNIEFDKILINFIYPLSDGSIIIGNKTIKHEEYPESASSARCESNINLWHIIPNFNKYNQETDYENDNYLHSSIIIYYNNIFEILPMMNDNININKYLINNCLCILALKHYIKSIWHTLHRPCILYIPPFPMLQMLGIRGIYIGRNRGNNNRHLSITHSLSDDKIIRTLSLDACDNERELKYADTLLYARFNKRSISKSIGMKIINLEYNLLIINRQEWIKGKIFNIKNIEISQCMIHKNDIKIDSINNDNDNDSSDDEYGIKRKKNKLLSFKNATSCITLTTMAMSELLEQTHCSYDYNWIKSDMKTPNGLYIFEHKNNNYNNNGYYHHKGTAILSNINCKPKYVYKLLCDPLFRFSYDIFVDSVQLIEKLDNKTYILRLVHTNKQCFLKSQRETILVMTYREIIPNTKYILAAVSIEHPQYPTENSMKYCCDTSGHKSVISKGCSKSIYSGFIRTDIKSSGWIIEKNKKNKTRVTYIMNVDFGGNVPASIKRNVAKKTTIGNISSFKSTKKEIKSKTPLIN
eukprot:401468_1